MWYYVYNSDNEYRLFPLEARGQLQFTLNNHV